MTRYAIEKGLINKEDLDLLDQHPYNIHLSLLAAHPERSPDIMRICNLQKLAILAIRLPFLEPVIRVLDKLPFQYAYSAMYSVCQAWEFRKWSSKTTFWRLIYEGILNYQAIIENHGDKGSILRKISLLFSGRAKNKIQVTDANIKPSSLEASRERMLVEQ
jgi:hypothetical protein